LDFPAIGDAVIGWWVFFVIANLPHHEAADERLVERARLQAKDAHFIVCKYRLIVVREFRVFYIASWQILRRWRFCALRCGGTG